MSGSLRRSVLLIVCFGLAMSCSYGATPAAESLSSELIGKVKEATVYLEVEAADGKCTGSGFLVEGGVVVTNAHVLGLSRTQAVLPKSVNVIFSSGQPGKERALTGRLLSADVAADLAFLEVTAGAGDAALPEPLPLAKGTELKETDAIFIAGFPFGAELALRKERPAVTIGSGTISSLQFDGALNVKTVQVNGDLNPGNSGGPIVDRRGRVIAVSVATVLGTQVGFGIPCDVLKTDLEGRVLTAGWRNRKQDGNEYSFDAAVTVVDPRRRIKEAFLELWTAQPPPPGTRPSAVRKADDGPLLTKKIEPKPDGPWMAQVTAFKHPPGTLIRSRIRWADETGVRSTETVQSDDIGEIPELFDRLVFGEERRKAGERPLPPKPDRPASQEPVFEAPQAPAIVQVPAREALQASVEHDAKGRPYHVLNVKPDRKTLLAPDILQLRAAPDGSEFYSIHKELSEIKVWDPATFEEKAVICVPRYPVSLCCDGQFLQVACTKSQIVLIIDRATRKPVQAIRWKDRPEMEPIRVHGRSPKGEWLTHWGPKESSSDRELLFSTERGIRLAVGTFSGLDEVCAMPDGERFLLLERERPCSWQRANHQELEADLSTALGENWKELFIQKPLVAFDRRHIFFFTSRQQGPWRHNQKETTLAVSKDLKRVDFEFPGIPVCEVPAAELLVSIQNSTCYYVRRSDGRVLRKASLWSATSKGSIYVPGHEVVVTIHNSAQGEVSVYRIGPVDGWGEMLAGPVSENNAPTTAKVGESVSFQPQFTPPEGAKSTTFRLAKGPHDAKVDPQTGAFNWKATRAYLGRIECSIVATVDGKERPCYSWVMQVGN